MPVTIHSVYPASSAINIDLYSYVQIVFSTGIDPTTIGEGSLFIEGSDRDIMSGPYLPINYKGSSVHDVLRDPAYHGIVDARYEFDGVGTDGTTPVSTSDTSMTSVYLSRVTLRPEKPLSPLTQYTVYSVGTGTSTHVRPGISRRTVFDAISNTGNSGSGAVYPSGGHTAAGSHAYEVDILVNGYVGSSVYKWRKGAGAYSGPTVTHSYKRLLGDGVVLSFGNENPFMSGDSYTFQAREPESMTGLSIYTFVTGERGSSIVAGTGTSLISTAAPPIVGDPSPGLSLGYTYPTSPGCNMSTDQTSFTFYFNKTLSTSSILNNGIEIYVGAPDGDTSVRTSVLYTATSVSASGSALTINL